MRNVFPVRFAEVVKPPAGMSANGRHPLKQGLTAFWSLSGPGYALTDAVLGGLTSRAAGTLTWAETPYGLNPLFDGNTELTPSPTSGLPAYQPTTFPFTIVARARLDASSDPDNSIIYTTDSDSGASTHYRGAWLSVTTSSGTRKLRGLFGDDAGGLFVFDSGKTLSLATWYTLGVSFDRGGFANQFGRPFINGVKSIGSQGGVPSAIASVVHAGDLAGIAGLGNNAHRWHGAISWIGIWNRALNDDEHMQLHIDPFVMFRQSPLLLTPSPPATQARVSQLITEVLAQEGAQARLSQEIIEILELNPSPVHGLTGAIASQVAIETVRQPDPIEAILSQLTLEVLRPYPKDLYVWSRFG